MGETKEYDFVILRICFNPYLLPNSRKSTLIRQRQPPKANVFDILNWFTTALVLERSLLPLDTTLLYYDWDMLSGDEEMFTIRNVKYDNIVVLFGVDSLHWIFYKNLSILKRCEGVLPLDFSFCPCCLNNNYVDIMFTIIDRIHEPDIKQVAIISRNSLES